MPRPKLLPCRRCNQKPRTYLHFSPDIEDIEPEYYYLSCPEGHLKTQPCYTQEEAMRQWNSINSSPTSPTKSKR